MDRGMIIRNQDTGESYRIKHINDQLDFEEFTKKSRRYTLPYFRIPRFEKSDSLRRHSFKSTTPLVVPEQLISTNQGALWVLTWNSSGTYLATGGQLGVVCVWKRQKPHSTIIETEPIRRYSPHASDVITLAWSCTNHLLSGSMDHAVRLWHPDREDCIGYFQHAQCVTSVEFHPFQENFVSGCADGKLRLWDTKQGRVRDWKQINKPITAVAISPDGETIAVGLSQGEVYFFHTQDLVYYTEIHCKNKYGAFKEGTKVTGIEFLATSAQMLVTTNDSRLRLFSLETYTQLAKFKGHINESMLIRAHVSSDNEWIVCGSEKGWICIWPCKIGKSTTLQQKRTTTTPVERLQLCMGTITSSAFWPCSDVTANHYVISGDMDGNLRVNSLTLS